MRPTKVLIGAIKLSQRENSCDRDAPNEADGRSPPCYHPWPAIGSAEACGHPQNSDHTGPDGPRTYLAVLDGADLARGPVLALLGDESASGGVAWGSRLTSVSDRAAREGCSWEEGGRKGLKVRLLLLVQGLEPEAWRGHPAWKANAEAKRCAHDNLSFACHVDAVVWPHSPDGVPRCQPLLARAFMRGRMARRCAASGCATTYPTAFTAALSLGWSPRGLRLPSNKAVRRCRALSGIRCIIPDALHCTLSSLQTAIQTFENGKELT